MSIVSLMHVTLIGSARDEDAVLAELQAAGLMHVVSLVPPSAEEGPRLQAEAVEALRYLQSAPIQRTPVAPEDADSVDLVEVQRNALRLKAREADLSDELDHLAAKAEALEPWGDFEFPALGALGTSPSGEPLRLWFYVVPTYRLSRLSETSVPWEVVARAPGLAYVVAVSDVEPDDIPVPRAHTGAASLSSVRRRMREIRQELEDLTFRRAELTKLARIFEEHIDDLLDGFEREEIARRAWSDGALFALAGWIPRSEIVALEAIVREHHLAVTRREPRREDGPPTLLSNRGLARAGQSLLTFYTTPNYFEWDPSLAVFASFTVFFAMIMSDAGYALLLAAALGIFWRPCGRAVGRAMRGMFAVMLVAALVWGMLVGSYFGLPPPEGALATLHVLSIGDYDQMMRISIIVGAAHVVLANLVRAVRVPGSGALGAVGWCVAVGTGLTLWLSQPHPEAARAVGSAAPWLFGGAGGLVVLFSSTESRLPRRLLDGARALTNVTSAFGDVLSYLRLFALGLASTSLGLAFNGLAKSSAEAGGAGLLLAGVVLMVGHGINLGLAIMSGFVHGLRLNFIEFLRWGTSSEGRPFEAFSLRRRASSSRLGS
jgi:V/A-type H+-transporting ATPase subunit I